MPSLAPTRRPPNGPGARSRTLTGARTLRRVDTTDPYASDAPFYDLIHGRDGDDTGLWLSFAGRTDRPVLEVGTGTGRIGIALARAGHTVVGVDPSAAMLAVAREVIEDDALDTITLLQGRVTDLALEPEYFGFVLVPADVFLYCEDGEDQVATLQFLAASMTYNGRLALDLPGPASWQDPSTNGQPLLVYSGPLEDGSTLDAWQVHEDDLATQSRILRMTYETTAPDGLVRRRVGEHRLRYLYRFEVEYLLARAGLAQVDVYGDYDLGPLTNESERMIVIARRVTG